MDHGSWFKLFHVAYFYHHDFILIGLDLGGWGLGKLSTL